jgi:RNA polymerase sigma factor (sigma-70 family)
MPDAPDTDAELDAIQAGDTEAFARWFSMVEHDIRLSLRGFGTRVDTEAVFQEAMLRVWNAARHVVKRGPHSLLRYAITTARRAAIDEIRRAGHEVPLDAPETPEMEDPHPAAADPFLMARIRDCFGSLPGRPKAALGARMQDGGILPDRTLAERCRMKLNTFHQNIGRARRLMAECLEAHGVVPP